MTTKKRKFGGKTLAFLMVFYLLLGSVVFPYLNRTTYDDNNPPPPSFPVVVGGGHFAPLTWDYADINERRHYALMREEVEFEESLAHISLKVLSSDTYELQAKTEIYTIYYRYKINEDHTVTPLSAELKGLIIWIWALVYLVAMTILIAVGQLIWIAWKKYQNRHEEE